MDNDFDFKKEPDVKLIQISESFSKGAPQRSAALAELEKRRFWRIFWSWGFAAWVALAISIISILLQVFKVIS